MTTFRDELQRFIVLLRERGLRISVAETMDAMNAVVAAGIERSSMCEALAATLVKDEADRPVFDETFAAFFRAPERGRTGKHAAGEPAQSGGRGTGAATEPLPKLRPNAPEQARPGAAEERERPEREVREEPAAKHAAEKRPDGREVAAASRASGRATAAPGVEAQRHAAIRAAERKPFAQYSHLDYEIARDALKPLARRFRVRLGRRLRLSSHGRLDFRRTIRASTQRGGALIDLRFRSRRPRHIDLLLLADISGSMRYSSQLMLELLAGAASFFRRVWTFAYIDRLAEAGFENGHLVMTPALDLYALSDFGRVLVELGERRAELLGRATVLVILGDARNNRRPPRADLLRQIARRCRAVIWLNPEALERWNTGDSVIELYKREVNTVLPARDLRELAYGLERVA